MNDVISILNYEYNKSQKVITRALETIERIKNKAKYIDNPNAFINDNQNIIDNHKELQSKIQKAIEILKQHKI